jgi:hypothetical protein
LKILGTKEAFNEMIHQRGIYKTLEVETGTVSNWRKAIKAGSGRNYPTLDLMEKMLLKAGWTVAKEKEWNKP